MGDHPSPEEPLGGSVSGDSPSNVVCPFLQLTSSARSSASILRWQLMTRDLPLPLLAPLCLLLLLAPLALLKLLVDAARGLIWSVSFLFFYLSDIPTG